MAFDDSFTSCPYETEAIVLPSKRFFPADINIQHWQLRNLISSPSPGLIYYSSRKKVFQLNLNTNKLTLIAELAFPPRQTASGYGYVCCGGEEFGLLFVINVYPLSPSAADVDDQLPIEFGERDNTPPKPTVDLEQVGTNIINSINIYKLKGDSKNNIQDDVVAVLTNNDKTVRILSLTERVETAVLDVAFQVNHATISPDGQTLVAVGDFQQAYFFDRVNLDPAESRISTAKHASSHCRWVLLNIVNLHVPSPAPISGYFSTAWSCSGALCAVASENGYITVLDTSLIKAECLGEDAIITIVSSTRPHPEPGAGAVRSLQFSPDPWDDLLIWSEGRGRVCVADMRYNLNSRQVLHLDPDEPNLSRIKVELTKGEVASASRADTLLIESIKAHYRSNTRLHGSASEQLRRYQQNTNVLVEQFSNTRVLAEQLSNEEDQSPRSGSRRRFIRVIRDDESSPSERRVSDQNLHDTELEERMIMDVLSNATLMQSSGGPRSIRYRAWERQSDHSSSQRNAEAQSNLDVVTRGNNRIQILADMMNGGHLRTETQPTSARRPRRQASIVISSGENERTPSSTSRGADTSDDASPRSSGERETSASRASPPDFEMDSDAVRARLARAREREGRLREAYQLSSQEQDLLDVQSLRSRQDGSESFGMLTAGLIVSEDGQTLWAGCQKGIFEYKMNMRQRMNFPSFETR